MQKENIAILIAVISGTFAIIVAGLNWYLTRRATRLQTVFQFQEKRYSDVLNLYVRTYELLEIAIASMVKGHKAPEQAEFSQNSAKMRLLAPEPVYLMYYETTRLLEEWSRLHALASPKTITTEDGRKLVISQAPDPTEKYKKPAEEAHEKLHSKIEELVELMRKNIDSGAPSI